MANRRRPRRDEPSWRGARPAGRDHRRRAGANGRGDRRHGRRGEATWRAGARRGGHAACAFASKGSAVVPPSQCPHRRAHRGDLGRRGEPAGLCGGEGRTRTQPGSLVVFDTGGGSSKFTFGHDAMVDERFSVDVGACAIPSATGSTAPSRPRCCSEAMAAIRRRPLRVDGRPVPDALVAWAAR